MSDGITEARTLSNYTEDGKIFWEKALLFLQNKEGLTKLRLAAKTFAPPS
ncbi:MAG: hypothetical protein OEX08_00635 [Candidatus Nomurabacteria bacterium]|nr:hypothetical protein [Candidatus Nomurabacteria bacterium]